MLGRDLILILPIILPLVLGIIFGMFVNWRALTTEHEKGTTNLEKMYNEEMRRRQVAAEKKYSVTLQALRESTLAAQEWHRDYIAAIDARNEALQQVTELQRELQRDANTREITIGLN